MCRLSCAGKVPNVVRRRTLTRADAARQHLRWTFLTLSPRPRLKNLHQTPLNPKLQTPSLITVAPLPLTNQPRLLPNQFLNPKPRPNHPSASPNQVTPPTSSQIASTLISFQTGHFSREDLLRAVVGGGASLGKPSHGGSGRRLMSAGAELTTEPPASSAFVIPELPRGR